jgi:hypothetical protein
MVNPDTSFDQSLKLVFSPLRATAAFCVSGGRALSLRW